MSFLNQSFTDQKQRIATEEECKAGWGGIKGGKRFRCYICGHKFKPGDKWRWIYGDNRTIEVDGIKYGVINFLVCDKCDSPNILDRWVEINTEIYKRFWWLL